jgi:hypothetical protein
MVRSHKRFDLLRVLCVLCILCVVRASAAVPALAHLNGIDELKNWFNANKGRTRLVLLLSPT